MNHLTNSCFGHRRRHHPHGHLRHNCHDHHRRSYPHHHEILHHVILRHGRLCNHRLLHRSHGHVCSAHLDHHRARRVVCCRPLALSFDKARAGQVLQNSATNQPTLSHV